jgi:predicted nucleic acid-binding protein
MTAVVIADAGPLIGLSRVGQLDLLPQLYTSLWITDVVQSELLVQPAGSFQGQAQIRAPIGLWLQVQADFGSGFVPQTPHLDAGERSSVALCLKHPGSLLIVDDRAARAEARLHNIAVTGLVGVLLLARERGLLKALRPVLSALREQHYFISDALVRNALHAAGEPLSD